MWGGGVGGSEAAGGTPASATEGGSRVQPPGVPRALSVTTLAWATTPFLWTKTYWHVGGRPGPASSFPPSAAPMAHAAPVGPVARSELLKGQGTPERG